MFIFCVFVFSKSPSILYTSWYRSNNLQNSEIIRVAPTPPGQARLLREENPGLLPGRTPLSSGPLGRTKPLEPAPLLNGGRVHVYGRRVNDHPGPFLAKALQPPIRELNLRNNSSPIGHKNILPCSMLLTL